MTKYQLVLQNQDGKVVRTFVWDGKPSVLIQRGDTRRLEIHRDVARLTQQKIPFVALQEINQDSLAGNGAVIPPLGQLRFGGKDDEVIFNELLPKESDQRWWYSVLATSLMMLMAMTFILTRPTENIPTLEEELKQHVVKIIKRSKPIPPPSIQAQMISRSPRQVQATPTKAVQKSVKRMGALAALGDLKNSAQKGGVNLGAINASAGPGLGGKGGSGGVQKSLYGKGLIAAPVGEGANMQGGGGYGTKGKGGGRSGYGTHTLVGSSGTGLIPLGKEAIIQGGLDKDLIKAVFDRNIGQVRFCYEQGLQTNPRLGGRVALDFKIGGNGQVTFAQTANTTLNSKLVEDCILARLRTWKFPLPEGGVEVSVSYPILLSRKGRG